MDVPKRNALYKEWQQITHDEVPYVFLFTFKISETVFTNRFENTKAGPVYPGRYGLQHLKLKKATK
jgi:ABC-type transport system substrate-binding protein